MNFSQDANVLFHFIFKADLSLLCFILASWVGKCISFSIDVVLLLPYFHSRNYEGGKRAKNKIEERKKNAEYQSGLTSFP